MKKFFTAVLILLLVYPAILHSQEERMILRSNGERIKLDKQKPIRDAISKSNLKTFEGKKAKHAFAENLKKAQLGVIDTLHYLSKYDEGPWHVNFGFFGQDVMMQWFVAPTNLTIKAAGFACSDETGALNGFDVGLRLIRLNWNADSLKFYYGKDFRAGYYPAENDGFNNGDFFGEEATGVWVDQSRDKSIPIPPWANNPDPSANTFNYDLWSDNKNGYKIIPSKQETPGNYQWVEMSNLGSEPEVTEGEVFAVVIIHNGTNLDLDRIGFYASQLKGYPGWKYYENGRLLIDPVGHDDPGWWIRSYTWDFAVVVELTGDRAPQILDYTKLVTTYSTEPREIRAHIIDDNPGGGPSGVASVELKYTLNDGDEQSMVMEYEGNDIYKTTVSFDRCDRIDYYIYAKDVNENESKSKSTSYYLFCNQEDALFIYNGFDDAEVQLLEKYYKTRGTWYPHDIWFYGPVEGEMLDHYIDIIEIHSFNFPLEDNRQAIREWLEEGHKKLLVMGQEVLGYLNGFTDSTFHPGDFEYDVLGVSRSYNDVIDSPNIEGYPQREPSVVEPVPDSYFGNRLYIALQNEGIGTLLYDPYDMYGEENWMDQFDPRNDLPNHEVFILGESVFGVKKPIGHNYYDDTKNNRIVFMSFDCLFIQDTARYWWGNDEDGPLNRIILKFSYRPNVDTENDLRTFHLSQNYPNPFNPTTKIKYTIPNVGDAFNAYRANIKLSIYDILGRKVAVLVNEAQSPGNYEIEFGVGITHELSLPSGVYFYTLSAGEYRATRKMILLK